MIAGAQIDDDVARAFLLEPYEDFLTVERGVAPRTREAYTRDIARVATFSRARAELGGGADTTRAGERGHPRDVAGVRFALSLIHI